MSKSVLLDSSSPSSDGQYAEPSELGAVLAHFAKPLRPWHRNSFAYLDFLPLAGIVGFN